MREKVFTRFDFPKLFGFYFVLLISRKTKYCKLKHNITTIIPISVISNFQYVRYDSLFAVIELICLLLKRNLNYSITCSANNEQYSKLFTCSSSKLACKIWFLAHDSNWTNELLIQTTYDGILRVSRDCQHPINSVIILIFFANFPACDLSLDFCSHSLNYVRPA